MIEANPPMNSSVKAEIEALIRFVTHFKWSMFSVWLLCVSMGLAVAFLSEPRYESAVTLVAADKRSVSPGVGQLGGLASLAGLSIGASNIQEPIAFLKSRRLARLFITRNELLPVLFAEDWDSQRKAWRADLEPDRRPTVEDGVDLFVNDIRAVTEDRRTGVVTLTINWRDAPLAAQWADQYVALLNSTMQRAALNDLEVSIRFLKQQLSGEEIVSLQQSIGRVLETELQKLTVARGTNEYALKVIDNSSVPQLPVSPNKALLLLLFGFLGLVGAILQAVIRYKWHGTGYL